MSPRVCRCCGSVESLEITSTKADVLSVNEDDLSLPVNIPINTLNNITDILRTPRARACAAAQAELQRKWIDRTPEGEFQRAVPRSILKSGKLDRGTSPSRTRLQFDLPSSGSSSIKPSESPLDTSKTFQKIIQPNFEESLEYNGDEICSPMETEENVEPTLEEFVPLITSDSESHSDHGSENEKRIDYNNLPFEIGSVLQKSSEVQDEDEHEQQGRTDYCETITEVEMQDEDCLYFVENTTEKLVERQEDDDISQESCAEISIKNSGQENLNDIMLEEQEVDSSVELQEDCCYVDVTTFVKCEAVVSAKLGRVTTPVSGNVMEGATLTLDTEMKPSDQSRNGVKDNQKEKTTETNAPQISAITENKKSTPDLLLGVSHVKLVDHSSNHPTKECSFAPPTKEMEHKITESLAGLFTSDKSSNLCSVTKTQLEVLPASVCQEHSSRADIESEMDVLLRTPCVEYSESLDPDVAVLSKQRSNRKSSRTSTPATPTRQSLRLREKGLGSSIIAMDSVEESMQSSNAKLVTADFQKKWFVYFKSAFPSNKVDIVDMNLMSPARKRTRKKSSSSDTDLCMPLSKSCNDLPEESLDRDLSAGITSMPSDRVLRSMSWKTPDVNKGPESNQQLDVIHETPVHRSRSRKTSTTDEEHASVVRRSPSRRTPSSVRKLSGGRPSTSKRSNSRSKTVKTLEGATMVSEKKILDVPSSRRRSLSESGIPDVKEYSGKVEVWNTIAGVEAESGSRESRIRTLPDADIDEVSRNKRQTRSRARRSTSANSTFRRELIEPSNEMP
ncbi:hypothetical protein DICVIV_01649 [Dictyocaulus viviparus]|uniref:Uncharacterized protein n=1 Tax=Dictyocaulus viviparus TaxID=29172 RepID=A0A0D8Y888_DICVI|nr:hypothetical protein DICVIV_01649 [Dictyocaulus viviparus]